MLTMLFDEQLRLAFIQLAKQPDTAMAVCVAAADGRFVGNTDLYAICTKAGVPQSSSYQVEKVLASGATIGVFRKQSELNWGTVEGVDYRTLALLLGGATLYRDHIFKPDNLVDVVLTTPPRPSKLEWALDAMGYRASFLENTEEIFTDLATRSTNRFLIMTPFIDNEGGKKICQLFNKVPIDANKQLIVRCENGIPSSALLNIEMELKELDVKLFNYWLPKTQPGTYETYHAKVILSDHSRCYVGSANMTQASFAYSMELGFIVEGSAAKRVAWICDSIMETAQNFLNR